MVLGTVPSEAQIPVSELRLHVQQRLDDDRLPVALGGTCVARAIRRSHAIGFSTTWLIGLTALLLVATAAFAGPSPSVNTSCNVVPLMMCGAPAPNPPPQNWDYGYTLNAPTPMKLAAPGGGNVGPGNFQVIQVPGGSGSAWVGQNLAGYKGCVTQGDSIQTHAGNEIGPVARDLNARLGVYFGNLIGSEAQYPPDVITTQPSPALTVNTAASGCSRSSPCIQDGYNGPIVTASNIDSLGLFDYNAYEADLSKQKYTNPPPTGRFNHRVLSLPVGNCSGGSGGSSSIPIIGFACFFLLQQPTQQGNSLWIVGQYVGHCNADGTRDARLTPIHSRTSSSSTTAAAHKPGLVKSPHLEGVDKEVDALVQELRDLPGDQPVHVCTTCNTGYKVGAERRREIYDRLDALGSAAVPALARMLQSSLQGPDYDLSDTTFSILDKVSGPYTSRDGKQHEKNDISAALPVLILALDDRVVGGGAARLLGTMGPKASQAVPKLVAMLDDVSDTVRGDACGGLEDIDALPALRQARSDPSAAKKQFAQYAVAKIEQKCFVEPLGDNGSSCDAPPFGDTPAAYEAFAKPYISISLGPVIPLLQQMCYLKSHPNMDRSHIGLRFAVSDEDLNRLSTVALVEQQLAAIVNDAKVSQQACRSQSGYIHTGPPCRGLEKGADEPADLFLCFEPDGSCQHIPATPSTPIKTLLECQGLAQFLLSNTNDRGRPSRPGSYTDERYLVPGAAAWYECRSRYLDAFEPQLVYYRLIASDAVWVQIDSRFPLYVDTASITVRGDRRRAWFQTRFPPHTYKFDAEKHVATESTLWDFSCASKDVRILGCNLTLDDGSTQRGAPDWTPLEVKPSTLVDLEMQYLCKLPLKRAP